MKERVFRILFTLILPTFVLCGCHATTHRADASKSYTYDGPHPVYVADGLHHWCDIREPHSHYFRPVAGDRKALVEP